MKSSNRPYTAAVVPPPPAAEGESCWRIHELDRSLGEHGAAWGELNDRLYAGHPMLTRNFVDGLLRHFGAGTEQLAICHNALGTCAMLILQRRAGGLWSVFRPAQAQVGCALVNDAKQLSSLFRALPGMALAVDLMCLDTKLSGHLDGAGPTLRLHHVLTMSIQLDGGYEHYMTSRSGGLRQNLRRYERRADGDGFPVRYAIADDPLSIHAAVARYCELESAGWKGTEGTALSAANAQGTFYTDLLVKAASTRQGAVHELWLGDQLAASRLVVWSQRDVVMLKTSYDESLSKYAPGRVLLRHVVEHCFEHHAGAAIEFYTDATKDQLSWATQRRSILNVRLYRNPAVSLVFSALRTLRQQQAKEQHPPAAAVSVEHYVATGALPTDAVELMEDTARERGTQAGTTWYDTMTREVFSAPAEPLFFVLRNGQNAVAVLPAVSPDKQSRRPQSLGNYYTASYLPAIAPWLKARDLLPLIHGMRSHWPQAQTWTFGPMDPHSQEFHVLKEALHDAGLVAFQFFNFGNWSLRCAGLSWRDYLESREGSVRSTIARMSRRLAAKGGCVEIITGADRLDDGIAAFERVYASSWKRPEPFPGFVRELMRQCAAKGWLRLGVAWLGTEPVAAQFWIVSHGRAEIFKLAYDQRYKSLSSGTLLTAQLMEHVLDVDKVGLVDYLGGDDPYKKEWMTTRGERWSLVAYDPWSAAGLWGITQEVGGRLLKLLRGRQTPGVGKDGSAPW
jgi:CelD/BcsL family acetyltransferase involved in cellulose biosynthesis